MMTIGKRIAKARRAAGLNVIDASAKLRINPYTLSRLENDHNVMMYTFIEACRLFNISLDEAVYGTQADCERE